MRTPHRHFLPAKTFIYLSKIQCPKAIYRKQVVGMVDEEYEILPHQVLADLKYEVEALKKKLTQPDAKANELILEIESMKDAVHELTVLFQKALEVTKEEDYGATLRTVQEKLAAVVQQNETIAKGMVAIADKLEDFMQKQSLRQPVSMTATPAALHSFPSQHTMGAPLAMPRARIAPPPLMESPAALERDSDFPLPPPAPGKEKRRSFGMFR